jgi:cytochrome c-type biogenesis protein CcmH
METSKLNSALRRYRFPLFLLVLLGVILSPLSGVSAQDPQPTPSDNEVNRVAKQLFCPVCENIPLDVCPTQACHEWRELIRQKIADGWQDDQIKEYFALQYGDRVLSEPPRRGLNWLVYLLPPVFFLGGAVLLFTVLSRMRKQTAASADTVVNAAPETAASKDPYLTRVEEELNQRK